jgi:tetratricopeptide (TPR) repeat protein
MAASTQSDPSRGNAGENASAKKVTLATALKWIGGITAVISLLLALNQVTGLLQNFRVHHKEFSEAMKAGQQEQERGDYPAAFDSFKRAVELDPVDRDAQKHQAQAAMLWLENVQTRERSFTDTANLVLPVLDKSLSNAKGQYAADLLAHIGWANFLKSRDGSGSPDTIAKSYQDAVKLDPYNPYANAMWAHWILWQNDDAREAKERFAAALGSGRARPYVRELQLSAYQNVHSPQNDAELLCVSNEMRAQGEPIEPREQRRIFEQIFLADLDDYVEFAQVMRAVKPEDALATYDWLSPGQTSTDLPLRREYVAAFALEVAGPPAEALARYKALQRQLQQGNTHYSLTSAVNNAVQRLSAPKSRG